MKQLENGFIELNEELDRFVPECVEMDPELAHEIEAAWYIAYRGPLTNCNLPRYTCDGERIRWRNA